MKRIFYAILSIIFACTFSPMQLSAKKKKKSHKASAGQTFAKKKKSKKLRAITFEHSEELSEELDDLSDESLNHFRGPTETTFCYTQLTVDDYGNLWFTNDLNQQVHVSPSGATGPFKEVSICGTCFVTNDQKLWLFDADTQTFTDVTPTDVEDSQIPVTGPFQEINICGNCFLNASNIHTTLWTFDSNTKSFIAYDDTNNPSAEAYRVCQINVCGKDNITYPLLVYHCTYADTYAYFIQSADGSNVILGSVNDFGPFIPPTLGNCPLVAIQGGSNNQGGISSSLPTTCSPSYCYAIAQDEYLIYYFWGLTNHNGSWSFDKIAPIDFETDPTWLAAINDPTSNTSCICGLQTIIHLPQGSFNYSQYHALIFDQDGNPRFQEIPLYQTNVDSNNPLKALFQKTLCNQCFFALDAPNTPYVNSVGLAYFDGYSIVKQALPAEFSPSDSINSLVDLELCGRCFVTDGTHLWNYDTDTHSFINVISNGATGPFREVTLCGDCFITNDDKIWILGYDNQELIDITPDAAAGPFKEVTLCGKCFITNEYSTGLWSFDSTTQRFVEVVQIGQTGPFVAGTLCGDCFIANNNKIWIIDQYRETLVDVTPNNVTGPLTTKTLCGKCFVTDGNKLWVFDSIAQSFNDVTPVGLTSYAVSGLTEKSICGGCFVTDGNNLWSINDQGQTFSEFAAGRTFADGVLENIINSLSIQVNLGDSCTPLCLYIFPDEYGNNYFWALNDHYGVWQLDKFALIPNGVIPENLVFEICLCGLAILRDGTSIDVHPPRYALTEIIDDNNTLLALPPLTEQSLSSRTFCGRCFIYNNDGGVLAYFNGTEVVNAWPTNDFFAGGNYNELTLCGRCFLTDNTTLWGFDEFSSTFNNVTPPGVTPGNLTSDGLPSLCGMCLVSAAPSFSHIFVINSDSSFTEITPPNFDTTPPFPITSLSNIDLCGPDTCFIHDSRTGQLWIFDPYAFAFTEIIPYGFSGNLSTLTQLGLCDYTINFVTDGNGIWIFDCNVKNFINVTPEGATGPFQKITLCGQCFTTNGSKIWMFDTDTQSFIDVTPAYFSGTFDSINSIFSNACDPDHCYITDGSRIWIFDSLAQRFTDVTPSPLPGPVSFATPLCGHCFILTGDSLWVFDDYAHRFIDVTPIGFSGAGFSASSNPFNACDSNNCYITDGTKIWIFDDSTKTFSEVTPAGASGPFTTIASLCGQCFVLSATNVWIFDPNAHQFTDVTPVNLVGNVLSQLDVCDQSRCYVTDGISIWSFDNNTNMFNNITPGGATGSFSTVQFCGFCFVTDGTTLWAFDGASFTVIDLPNGLTPQNIAQVSSYPECIVTNNQGDQWSITFNHLGHPFFTFINQTPPFGYSSEYPFEYGYEAPAPELTPVTICSQTFYTDGVSLFSDANGQNNAMPGSFSGSVGALAASAKTLCGTCYITDGSSVWFLNGSSFTQSTHISPASLNSYSTGPLFCGQCTITDGVSVWVNPNDDFLLPVTLPSGLTPGNLQTVEVSNDFGPNSGNCIVSNGSICWAVSLDGSFNITFTQTACPAGFQPGAYENQGSLSSCLCRILKQLIIKGNLTRAVQLYCNASAANRACLCSNDIDPYDAAQLLVQAAACDTNSILPTCVCDTGLRGRWAQILSNVVILAQTQTLVTRFIQEALTHITEYADCCALIPDVLKQLVQNGATIEQICTVLQAALDGGCDSSIICTWFSNLLTTPRLGAKAASTLLAQLLNNADYCVVGQTVLNTLCCPCSANATIDFSEVIANAMTKLMNLFDNKTLPILPC